MRARCIIVKSWTPAQLPAKFAAWRWQSNACLAGYIRLFVVSMGQTSWNKRVVSACLVQGQFKTTFVKLQGKNAFVEFSLMARSSSRSPKSVSPSWVHTNEEDCATPNNMKPKATKGGNRMHIELNTFDFSSYRWDIPRYKTCSH